MNANQVGTKAAALYKLTVGAGETATIRLRLTNKAGENPFGREFDRTFSQRMKEADEFYDTVIPQHLSSDARNVMRQSFGGLLWSKQFYHYVVKDWLNGDPNQPTPPDQRKNGRNREWGHLYNADVISMPDKWEYPWYAAWDLAFHCVPLALVDSDFAKEQLMLMVREWYMHPNGQLPAYEWAFGDVNPPVHAWAAWRVYKIEKKRRGVGDRVFPPAHLPQAASQLHLVGKPKRRRRTQCVPGRLPRSRQHRSLRSQRATAHRRPPRTGRRHRLDGDVQP